MQKTHHSDGFFPDLSGDLHVLGLMSGTSGDGIDGALVQFNPKGAFTFSWHDHFPFSGKTRERLQALMRSSTADDIARAGSYMAELYADAVKDFQTRHREKVHLLAAHGQTLAHVPSKVTWERKTISGTLQVLNGSWLAERTGIPTVYDFRTRDMAVGGQGAPLVPFGDFCFFKNLPGDSVILNIGGIANVTVIRRTPRPAVVAAFDTGPGNMMMDALAVQMSMGKSLFDRGGRIAKMGHSDSKLLSILLKDAYFKQKPPKSTGRDLYGTERLQAIARKLPGNYPLENLMSTLLDVTVESIARALETFVLPQGPIRRFVTAGGGALNPELLRRLKARTEAHCPLELSDVYGIPIMAREAMAFAALGCAFARGIPGNVPAATGAKKEVILGSFAPV